jgi:AraC family transcriptional regulator, L-arginine-responsive activator
MFPLAAHDGPTRVAVVVLPPCSLLTLGAIVDPLLAANRDGPRRYEISYYLADRRVANAGGLPLPIHAELADDVACDLLLLASDGLLTFSDHRLFTGLLSRLAGRLPMIGGVQGGVWWLARAGLLSGYRASVHWQDAPQFSEQFPEVIVSQHLYEVDGSRITSCGGTATLDLMITLVRHQHREEIATRISEELCLERVRRTDERQRTPQAARLGAAQPKLTEALQLMEANVEEPLTSDEIADLVGVSRRQLERLFKQHLNALPSRYYLELRLGRARQLLQRSAKSIVQIGLSCGFSSGPHFSTAYRAHFGITPREERARSAGFGATANSRLAISEA